MKICINCGIKLVEDVRRCEKCLAIQPSVRHKQHRIGAPYLVLSWALLTLLVLVAWLLLGLDLKETIVFAISESAFGAGIIIIMNQVVVYRL
jgi:hypothetical protein